jgi:hypothetical protein
LRTPDLMSLALVLSLGAVACGSAAPAPIPDPGGPFQTAVPSTKSLSALNAGEVQQLCSDFATTDRAFLSTAVARETACRVTSTDSARHASAGGTDAGTFLTLCQASYDSCQQEGTALLEAVSCPLPAAAGCNATVELLSACINEIATVNWIARCVTVLSCDMAATNESPADAASQTPSDLPPEPACDRLAQQCPTTTLVGDPCR